MRAAGAGAVELVLPAGGRVGRDARAAAPAGRAVHADAVLWRAADDGLAAEPGASRSTCKRVRRLLRLLGLEAIYPKPRHEHAGAGASDLSRTCCGASRSPTSTRSGAPTSPTSGWSGAGSTWSRSWTGTAATSWPGRSRTRSTAPSAWRRWTGRWRGPTDDLQHRPGQPVHQPGVHRPAAGGRRADQHGWAGPRPRQHLRRAAVADGQVRGGVPEELPDGPGGDRGLGEYFRFYNEERLHQALAYRTPAAVYHADGTVSPPVRPV